MYNSIITCQTPDLTDINCQKFSICNEDPSKPGSHGETRTCANETRFDPVRRQCILVSEVQCATAPVPNQPGTCPIGGTGHFPALICIEFLICNNGTPAAINGECAVGMHFDSTTSQCNIASAVDCGIRT